MPEPFWKTKTLGQMSQGEWESLCDGCGRCCLNKLEDWDTGQIHWTNVACSLLDCETCRCMDYENRLEIVSDCIQLEPGKMDELTWLPPTCAYRLVHEGKDLFEWHHLVSGDPETVHAAGISVRGRTISETDIQVEDYENHLVAWPAEKV
ncbi:MAG: YcgN family cysteine cluster protein [Rhizobiaceae bacterium]